MKKRKPPIVLATFLIIMVAAVALMYSPARQGQGDQPEQPQAPTETEARPTMTQDQSAAIVKSAMTAKPNMPRGGPQLQKPGMPGSSTEPSIKMSKPANYKPTPNDSSTSTQWYTNETPK